MAVPRTVPAVLGAVACIPTTAILTIHIILPRAPVERLSPLGVTAIHAASFEAVVLVAIPLLSIAHMAPGPPNARVRFSRRLWLAVGLIFCTITAGLSVANIVCLSRVVGDSASTILGWRAGGFLAGAAVASGLAFATQAIFFVFHFLTGRTFGPAPAHPEEGNSRTEKGPYRITTTGIWTKSRGSLTLSPASPGSSGGRTPSQTMSSLRLSLSSAIRPITSRTRLLSVSRPSLHWPSSLDLARPQEARSRSTEEGFDAWDTSAVDPDNRKTVLQSSSPPGSRVLETIPASPPISRSPSPAIALDSVLEPPPRSRRRTRSYSPRPGSTGTIQSLRTGFTQHQSHSEAHIHPLFRSDSPTPPPAATPGTIVFAAPNAGKVISDRQSIRSIHSRSRLRSESLPGVPSPLSQNESVESFFHRREESGSTKAEIPEEEEEEASPVAAKEPGATASASSLAARADGERKMTPPIPEWILTAGMRLSLVDYHSRRSRRSLALSSGGGGSDNDLSHAEP